MLGDTALHRVERATRAVQVAHAIAHIPAWVILTVSGLSMTGIYYFAFTQRYRLAEHLQPMQTIATLNNMAPEGALIYIVAFLALFGLYALALRWGLRVPARRQWLLVAGFAILFNAVLLPMYSFDAADIYDYIIRGRLTAVYGLNPMHDVPSQVSSDPFYSFAGWHNVSSAYGPGWEMIAGLTSRLAGNDHIANVVAFKLVSVIGYALTALLIGLTLARLAPQRTLLGVGLFAWNPLVVFMTGGRGHNDLIMTACILFSIYCLTRRWYAASTLGALLGALVKFIPALLIPIIGLVALRELNWRGRVRYVITSALVGAILVVAIYGPFWAGIDTLRIEARGSMFTGTAATLLRQVLSPALDGRLDEAVNTPVTDALLQRVALALFAVFYLWQLVDIVQNRDNFQVIRSVTLILTFYLLVAVIWFQSWYAIWILALVALLDNSPLRRLVLYFSYLVTWESLLYNYVTLRPDGWMPIPWRDLIPIAAFMGPAWAYVAWFWITTWWRGATRTPERIALGKRLHDAREVLKLPVSQLADELDLRTDDLIGYEQGDRTMSIETAQRLCQRLYISLADLVVSP